MDNHKGLREDVVPLRDVAGREARRYHRFDEPQQEHYDEQQGRYY